MNKIVLLIEDEEKTATMLKQALEFENIPTEWVTNGADAIEKIQSGNIELVILDLKLPVKTGDEILADIREINPYVEVVVYTNYQDPPVMKKLMNLGVDGYINKGAEADLWETVVEIKKRLAPLDEVEIKKLINATPDGFLNEETMR